VGSGDARIIEKGFLLREQSKVDLDGGGWRGGFVTTEGVG